MELRCDGVVFNVSLGSALTSFWTVDTPVRCAGSVYGYVNPSSFSSAHVSLTGFEMSDVDFNKPYEVATSTSSGGGSGGTVEVDLTGLNVGIAFVLFFLSSGFFIFYFKRQ